MANYNILLQSELRWVNRRYSFAKGLGGARCRRVVASSSASQEIDTSMGLLGLCSGSPLAANVGFLGFSKIQTWPQRKATGQKPLVFVNLLPDLIRDSLAKFPVKTRCSWAATATAVANAASVARPGRVALVVHPPHHAVAVTQRRGSTCNDKPIQAPYTCIYLHMKYMSYVETILILFYLPLICFRSIF